MRKAHRIINKYPVMDTKVKMNNTQQNILQETSDWLHLLEYLQQEIVYMKTQLAEIVRGNVTKDVLAQLEHYQNMFLTKDTVIAFFRKDVLLLRQRINADSNDVPEIGTLRKDIDKLAREFSSLRNNYQQYAAAF